MKKFIGIISAVLILATVFTGCTFMPYLSRDTHLYTTSVYNTLGFGGDASNTWVIEEDSYGRILFRFINFKGGVHGENVYGYGICQRDIKDTAYYYEDDCVLLCDEDFNVSQEALDALKASNDWDEELREELMSSAKTIRSPYQKAEYDCSLVEYAKEALPCPEGREWDYSIICSDSVGRQLILLEQYDPETYSNYQDTLCAVIVCPDGSVDTENGVLMLNESIMQDYKDTIKEFKRLNDWNELKNWNR